MSVEENKAIELRFCEEVINKGNLAVLDELLATNFVDHCAGPGAASDREGYKQFWGMLHAAFSDFHATVEDMVAEGDKVVQRFTARGTLKGEFRGINAPGKQVAIAGLSIHRITGGKIVENWVIADMLGVMQRLGVLPPLW